MSGGRYSSFTFAFSCLAIPFYKVPVLKAPLNSNQPTNLQSSYIQPLRKYERRYKMGRFDSEYFTKVKTSDLFGVPLGVIPSEFCQTIVPRLLCGIVCMILSLAVLDLWRTDTRRQHICYRACIASCGKIVQLGLVCKTFILQNCAQFWLFLSNVFLGSLRKLF